MSNPVRIAVKILVVYVAFSLIAGIVLAEMTLHPGRTQPDQTSISEMYLQYGAKLDPVSIHAADGIELRGWYSVPANDNGRAVVLLHGIGDNRGGAILPIKVITPGSRLLPDTPTSPL